MRRLQDRVAVVTGAASGIGRATAVLLAQRGCDLALVDIDEAGMKQTAESIEAVGRRVTQHVADVADIERMRELPDEIVSLHQHVHILMNNAGVAVGDTFEDHRLEDFERIVGINFWGVVYGCKFFLPYLKQQEEAHIVNLSSLFGLMGIPGQSSYCATKFAVRGLSEALLVELADTSVGVTSVHPGGIQTNIARSARSTMGDEMRQSAQQLFDRIGMPPERAAAKIVRAIERGKHRCIISRETYLADWLKRISPAGTQRLFAWAYRRRSAREATR